jgi:hypothetical protein
VTGPAEMGKILGDGELCANFVQHADAESLSAEAKPKMQRGVGGLLGVGLDENSMFTPGRSFFMAVVRTDQLAQLVREEGHARRQWFCLFRSLPPSSATSCRWSHLAVTAKSAEDLNELSPSNMESPIFADSKLGARTNP